MSSHRLDLSVQVLTGRGAEQDGVDQDRTWCGLLVLSWSTPRPVLVPVSEPEPSTWQHGGFRARRMTATTVKSRRARPDRAAEKTAIGTAQCKAPASVTVLVQGQPEGGGRPRPGVCSSARASIMMMP
jgi:hypothetical protein